jgi:gliding motility-associated-like protein
MLRGLQLAVFFVAFTSTVFSQTLIINEVSNGPSGTKEYVEYVVVDATVAYDCNGSPIAPCVDIRGWIIDDNSGYHGPGLGVAAGALRFSYDPLWQCVPVGTIILVYNDLDFDASVMPPNDVDLNDGNCSLVIPVTGGLIESNPTTPGDIACSYPAAGWVPATQWNPHGMSNVNDCARLVDLSGCEVFSLCYSNCNLNTLIYFSNSGGDKVWYFNGTDPYNQANWTEGCADPGACGSNDQTPGSANNVANAAYIAQFNNGCAPIPAMGITASSTDGPCPCAGEATASGIGSIAGYTYEWFDAAMQPIGQTTATATGLCDGTYFVTATSSVGCPATTSVTISNAAGTPAVVDPQADLCSSAASVTLSAAPGGGSWSATCGTCVNSATGEFDPALATPGVITVTYSITGICASSDDVTFTVVAQPDAGINATLDLCSNDAPADLFGSIGGTPDVGGTWSPALTSGSGMFDPAADPSGIYTYEIVAAAPCVTVSSDINVTVSPSADATIGAISNLCVNDAAVVLSAAQPGGVWSATCGGCIDAGTGAFDPAVAGVGNFTVTYSISGSCGDVDDITVTVDNLTLATINAVGSPCVSDVPFAITAVNPGGTWSATCGACIDAVTGVFDPSAAGIGTFTITYTTSGSCPDSQNINITVSTVTSATINPVSAMCTADSPVTLTAVNTGGTWSATCGSCIDAVTGVFNPAVSGAGTHTVTYTINGVCGDSQDILVTVNSNTLATINPISDICVNDPSVTFTAVNSGGTWSASCGACLNSSTGEFNPSVAGTGVYTISYTSSGTCSETQSVTVNVTDVTAVISANPVTGAAPISVNLSETGSGAVSWNWDLGNGTTGTTQNISTTYSTAGSYTVVVTATNGNCSDVASITIVVNAGLVIPNAFSPDGDGINDTYEILGIEGYPNNTLTVTNRWGDKVFEASPYQNDWDGTGNNPKLNLFGEKVVDGTYFYFFDPGDGSEVKTGYLVKKTRE